MFFCTGCQNVQAIDPGKLAPPHNSPASTLTPTIPTPSTPVYLLEHCDRSEPNSEPAGTLEKALSRVVEDPLPASDDDTTSVESDTRLPVDSSFDKSIYAQGFTLYSTPSSQLSFRVYEGFTKTCVTIDTPGTFTMPLEDLRKIVNTIEPVYEDPQRKSLQNSLLLMTTFFCISLALHLKR